MSEILQGEALLVPVAGFEITPLGIAVHGEPSYEAWEMMLKQVLYVRSVLPWVIGDLLNYGEARYGEKYAQAIEVTGYEYQSLANCASVCRRVPMERRQAELSFSHHALVASKAPEEQTRLLHEAWDNYMTTAQLRELTKPILLAENEPVAEPKTVSLELTEAELKALISLLERCGDDTTAGVLAKAEDLWLSL